MENHLKRTENFHLIACLTNVSDLLNYPKPKWLHQKHFSFRFQNSFSTFSLVTNVLSSHKWNCSKVKSKKSKKKSFKKWKYKFMSEKKNEKKVSSNEPEILSGIYTRFEVVIKGNTPQFESPVPLLTLLLIVGSS